MSYSVLHLVWSCEASSIHSTSWTLNLNDSNAGLWNPKVGQHCFKGFSQEKINDSTVTNSFKWLEIRLTLQFCHKKGLKLIAMRSYFENKN